MFRARTPVRAFTLVEVLVVLVIVGIAGAVVVPQMLKGGQMGLQAAARIAIADILYAQNEAVARQTTRRVVFDAEANSYRLTDAQGDVLPVSWRTGGGNQTYIVDFDLDNRFSGVTLENVSFADGSVLEFDALGSPQTGGTIELSANGLRYRVTVAAFTGQVTIQQVNADGVEEEAQAEAPAEPEEEQG